ncbi:hypothetical protein [Halobacteriaceae bacterium SHR40]|uniref:hypothetical protein n=1 Tax=Halovenus amylolytica TaxID=2500550 RepID=UPI000FE3321C
MAVIVDTVKRTGQALGLTVRDRRAQVVIGVSLVAYLLTYLYAIDKLTAGNGEFGMVVAARPWEALFRQSFGTFTYEPVALFRLGIVTYQFSLNTVIGLVIAALVAVNVGVSYFAWQQPSACGVGSQSAGLFAGFPALLSGAACCGPIIALIFGIQVTSGVLVLFEWLLPISVTLLLVALLLVGRQVNPAVAGS